MPSSSRALFQIRSHLTTYCSLWQVLICVPCSWGRKKNHINFQDHPSVWSQKCREHVISFLSKNKCVQKGLFSVFQGAQRRSLCIYSRQRGCETKLEGIIIPHLTQCHCHFSTAKMNCLQLFSKVKLMSDIL